MTTDLPWSDGRGGVVIYQRGRVLAVEAPISTYVIEPIRFDLGLTRVEMVDDHLKHLIQNRRQYGQDADTLLEARAQFATEEES
jgi:hypothetical protein